VAAKPKPDDPKQATAKDRVAFLENILRLGLVETVRLINLSSEHIGSWPDFVGLLWANSDISHCRK
jgi:hypothetical protein